MWYGHYGHVLRVTLTGDSTMTKAEHLADPNSCWNKAKDDEPIFVVLGRDLAYTATVHEWASARYEHGLNYFSDAKVVSALKTIADAFEYRTSQKRPLN